MLVPLQVILNDKKSNYNYNEFLYFYLHDKAKPNIAKVRSSSIQLSCAGSNISLSIRLAGRPE